MSQETPAFAVCVQNEGCDDLQLRRLYPVLADDVAARSGLVRVIDDSGEDYLYPASNFIAVPLPAAIEEVLAGLPASTGAR